MMDITVTCGPTNMCFFWERPGAKTGLYDFNGKTIPTIECCRNYWKTCLGLITHINLSV